MANKDHLDILKQGVDAWNQWRKKQGIRPDLNGANLIGANLTLIDFSDADLGEANLAGANLTRANLIRAYLRSTNLSTAILKDSDLSGAYLKGADLSFADLTGAGLINAGLHHADLNNANLNLAYLRGADLSEASLIKAKLNGINLNSAILRDTVLDEADFIKAKIGWTIFGNSNLSSVIGLEAVLHEGPSTIGIDTIYRSNGNIPEVFLRGAGVPNIFIIYARSLIGQAIEFYSCFISYSSKDQAFSERLYADLQHNGVRCWYAPEDLRIGEEIRVGIDESIRKHDKLLLVLSRHSVASNWVEKEVETALEQERKQKKTILFPIRLDDSVMRTESGWAADIRRTRNIGSFKKWKEHDSYKKAFERLLRDLKAEGGGRGRV